MLGKLEPHPLRDRPPVSQMSDRLVTYFKTTAVGITSKAGGAWGEAVAAQLVLMERSPAVYIDVCRKALQLTPKPVVVKLRG